MKLGDKKKEYIMKLLFINACIRGEESRTLELCKEFIETMKKEWNDLEIQTIDLNQETIVSLDKESLEQRNQWMEQGDWNQPEFQYAKDFSKADLILVGAPYWDMSFPSVLRNYVERISVNKITFQYVEAGSEGLCKAQRMVYIGTAGGYIKGIHVGEEYMRQMCELYGIPEFDAYCLEGLDIWGTDVEEKLQEAKEDIKKGLFRNSKRP